MPRSQPPCPVCGEPVGRDPHEDCLRSVQNPPEDLEWVTVPCPACGKEMAADHNCEA